MASKQRADKQKEKEKKEKIILGVLVGVLVIVGAFELPKILKSGGGSSTNTAAQTTSSSTTPGTTSSGIAASGPTTVGSLPNPGTYEPGAGQLSEISLFNGGDPFGNVATSSTGTSGTPTTPATTGRSRTSTSTVTVPSTEYAAAGISVNGSTEA
ncbi:MAG: hypothetical protein ACYDHO_08365, partial [Gaiellaceae bacterium]